jgi:hypothetical protein
VNLVGALGEMQNGTAARIAHEKGGNMFRRLMFVLGLFLGLISTVVVGTTIFTYLLTGKLPSVEMQETDQGARPVFKLLSLDEVLEMVKEKAATERGQVRADRGSLGLEGEAGDAS